MPDEGLIRIHGFFLQDIDLKGVWKFCDHLPDDSDHSYRLVTPDKGIHLFFTFEDWIPGLEKDFRAFAYWFGYMIPTWIGSTVVGGMITEFKEYQQGVQDREGDLENGGRLN